MTTYRLNRVPDKIYVRLLELLGVPMSPATPARARVRFMLAAPPEAPITLSAGDTEVGSVRTAYEGSVIFEVAESRTTEPLAPAAYVVDRDGGRRTSPSSRRRRPIATSRRVLRGAGSRDACPRLRRPLSRLLIGSLSIPTPAPDPASTLSTLLFVGDVLRRATNGYLLGVV